MKNLKIISVFIMGLCLGMASLQAVAEEEEDDTITHGEVAKLLAYHLGLFDQLPANPSETEAAAALSANGISPKGGVWDINKVLSIADFAKILTEAMGITDELVATGKDGAVADIDYVNLLKSKGVVVNSVSDAIENLDPLAEPKGSNVSRTSGTSDPLDERSVIGLPDESVQGTDASLPVSALSVVAAIRDVNSPSTRNPVTPN